MFYNHKKHRAGPTTLVIEKLRPAQNMPLVCSKRKVEGGEPGQKDIKWKGYYFSPMQGHAEPKCSNIFPPSEEIHLKGYTVWLSKQAKKWMHQLFLSFPLFFLEWFLNQSSKWDICHIFIMRKCTKALLKGPHNKDCLHVYIVKPGTSEPQS